MAGRTVTIEIFKDGTVSWQPKINGKPGGVPPSQFTQTTCVGGALLTGVHQNAVIVVGVRRDASVSIPAEVKLGDGIDR